MSTVERPRATIVVPASSNDPALGALVAGFLAHGEARVEVLVVHDGTTVTPRALEEIDDPRLIAIPLPGLGVGARANVGLAAARGAAVKILLERDAALVPGDLERELAELEAHPDCAAVAALWCAEGALLASLLEGRAPRVATATFCTGVLRALGGLDASLTHALGYDLWLRLALDHRVHTLPGVGGEQPVAWDGAGVPSRSEHAWVLVRTLLERGLDWWRDATSSWAADVDAWRELALRLVRSGLPEVLPVVRTIGRRARAEGRPLPPLDELERLASEDAAPASPADAPAPPHGHAPAPQIDARRATDAATSDAPSPHDAEAANVLALARAAARDERTLRTLRADGQRLEGYEAWLRSELGTLRRTSEETLLLATRVLDKLRLTKRLSATLQQLGRAAGVRKRGERDTAATTPERHGSHRVAPGARRRQWLILAAVPLDDVGGGQRSAQLARALARRGDLVWYAARFPRHESVDLGLRDAIPGLTSLDWNPDELRRRLRAADDRVLVLVELPETQVVELALEARTLGARVLYDKIDHWAACAWADWYDAATERRLIREADDLVGSARLLVQQLRGGARAPHLVLNAVDRTIFAPDAVRSGEPPADLVRGERTLLYVGSLWGDWFDWGLVAEVAARRPRWAVNLIGDRPRHVPELPSNVHLLGLKPQAALPPYLAAADVCWIPFIPSPLVDGVNPLKVYEYLAMHRPVVASPMVELRDVPYVFAARGAEATVAAVERAAATPPPVETLERFLAANDWEARVATLTSLCERPTITVVVLCYDNRDVIGACIESLLRNRGDARYEIVVVDNGSRDGSLEILAAHASRGEIRLLRNARNGCSSGRNLGVRESASELVVFLDSDQRALFPGWLDPALEVLARHREIGAVGWSGGWFSAGRGRGAVVDTLPDRGAGKLRDGFRTDVAYLATSGLVVPRSVLARTAGFDERLDPTCFEDTDLSFQIKEAGFELAYCPGLGVDHRPHATTSALAAYDEVYRRNERLFLEKWRHRPEYFFDVPD